MRSSHGCLWLLFVALFGLFCCVYPIAVIGVTFDVHPAFSLSWAGGALLFLEGTLLIIAAMLNYGWRRALLAALLVMILSYLVEALGVNTGFPFGPYRYTDILFPRLPGNVPMAVMFAWILIIFGAYGWVTTDRHRLGIRGALLGALLAVLLDLELEPVAAHLEQYWQWLDPGRTNYYGVPLANFLAWFVVACVLLLLIDVLLFHVRTFKAWRPRLAVRTPRLLFCATLIMFGLVDLTHAYYGAVVCGLVAGLMLWRRRVVRVR